MDDSQSHEETDLHLCTNDGEMELDINPVSDSDDSYSSSFEDTDSDSVDEFEFNKHYLANEMRRGFKRVPVENLDPVTQKLQSFLDSGVLPKQSMFYTFLKNGTNYLNWLCEQQENHSLQFQWDNEILQFLESLEYHGGRKVINLLRGPGHDGERSGGISGFNWRKWNWLLQQKTCRDKVYTGYSTENGTFASFLQSFLQLSSAADSEIITLFEDRIVKIISVALAKDAMQLKPGLLYDSKQRKLIGSTLNLNYDFIHEGETDKETLKASMVQEAEVMWLTTIDANFSRTYDCSGSLRREASGQ